MECKYHEAGFTFFQQLFILTVLMISLPLLGAIWKTFQENPYYDEISIQQFFYFLQHDVNQALDYNIKDNQIILEQTDGDKVSFSLYGNLIRRQVNNEGHEIYLRNVQQLYINSLPYGFTITIISAKGDQYEKTIVHHP